MKKVTVYITGSVNDINAKQGLIKAFKLVESFGYSCTHPSLDRSNSEAWVIRDRIMTLFGCTDILLLEGWNYCSVAALEYQIAQQLGMSIHTSIEELTNKYKKNGWA